MITKGNKKYKNLNRGKNKKSKLKHRKELENASITKTYVYVHDKHDKYSKHSKKETKFNKTYYIDSCLLFRKEYVLDRLIYHLERLGLKPDNMMGVIKKQDETYLRNKGIELRDGECYQNYKVPMQFDENNLRPMFLFQFTQYMDKRFYNVKSLLNNYLNLDKNGYLEKHSIHYELRDEFPAIAKKHLKKTFMIFNTEKYQFPNIYILRPLRGSSGKDILYISSKKEFEDAIDYYYKHNYFFNRDRRHHNYNVIASEYIMNPLLYKGKKCQIRIHYLITYVNKKYYSFLIEHGRVITAGKPYNTNLPFEAIVHDTHLETTNEDILFPNDFNNDTLNLKDIDIQDIIKQMRTILSAISTVVSKDDDILYENQKNGFVICGVDFMIDDTGKVFLIEINKTPGITFREHKNAVNYFHKLFDWLNECVLEPFFKGTDPKASPTYLPLML